MFPADINSVATALSGAIGVSDTILYVLDDSRIPEPPNLLVLGENSTQAETIKLIAKDGMMLTVERGFQGTSRSWNAGTTIARNFTAYDHDTFKGNIEILDQSVSNVDGKISGFQEGLDEVKSDVSDIDGKVDAVREDLYNLTIAEEQIENNAVTTTKIANLAVTNAKINDNAVNASKIQHVGALATSVALGTGASATGGSAVAVGQSSQADDVFGAIAIGTQTIASGTRSTALGASSTAELANLLQLGGNALLSQLRSRVSLSVTSDERDKTDILPINKGLEFIEKLEPMQYVLNQRLEYIDIGEAFYSDEETMEIPSEILQNRQDLKTYGLPIYDKEAHALGSKKGERKRAGVSAQQVQQALEAVYGTAD